MNPVCLFGGCSYRLILPKNIPKYSVDSERLVASWWVCTLLEIALSSVIETAITGTLLVGYQKTSLVLPTSN
jgi:hypothetical protein